MELIPTFSLLKINYRMHFVCEQTSYSLMKLFDPSLFLLLGYVFDKQRFQNFHVLSWYIVGILDGMFVKSADSYGADVLLSNAFTIVSRFENCV